jgi:hypothetical protein
MDSNYRDFLVPNGIIYPQKAENPTIRSGLHRVEISWQSIKDPKVIRSIIYWDNYTDSISIENYNVIDDSVRVDIDQLPEGDYTFYIRNYDIEGNVSIPSEISGAVYGENFIASLGLVTRPVKYEIVNENIWTVGWGEAAIQEGAIAVEIECQTNTGTKTIKVPVTEYITIVADVIPETTYRYRTIYFNPQCIDTLYSDYSERTISSKFTEELIPSNLFANAALPGDYYVPLIPSFAIQNVWNGDIAGMYVTQNPSPFPHHFTVDLGHTIILTRFKLFPRRTNDEMYKGASPRFFEIWGTNNPSADGSFENWHKLGEWEQLKPSGYGQGNDVGAITQEDMEHFWSGGNYVVEATDSNPNPFIQVRYLRVVIKSTFASYAGISGNLLIAEMEFYGGIFD